MARQPLHALRIQARELMREPGMSARVGATLDAAELGVADDRITGPVTVDAVAVSSLDAIAVDGTVSVPWRSQCRRCLRGVGGVADAEIAEVYQDPALVASGVDPDALPVEGDLIDLAEPVREYVLLELPDDPLCRDDCAGLCPVCGIDRNHGECRCDTTVRDERWAALDQLRLDDP